MHKHLLSPIFLLILLLIASFSRAENSTIPDLFKRDNLVVWCIVPFDAKQRGPEARAEMMAHLGFKKFAYDWRPEHIPTFDEEMQTLQRYGIELTAFWFPAGLNDEARTILDLLKRHKIKTQLWVTMHGGEIECTPEEQRQRVIDHANALRPVAEAAAEIGCTLGLYNHGAWFGEPENQIEIIKELALDNVGLVYNLHHGHAHVDRFPGLLSKMMPYLYVLNLNGTEPNGDAIGKKILPLGQGQLDLQLLQQINDSGYKGPIGILGHTMDDAEETLEDNLAGLDWLIPQLGGNPPLGPKPVPIAGRSSLAKGLPSLNESFGFALEGGMVVDGSEEFRTPPITVELRAKLNTSANFNILAACDTKASGTHWEIFSYAGSGNLTVYLSGAQPDHVQSDRNICDGNWHHIGMQYGPEHVKLFLNGEEIASQAITRSAMPAIPGGLAFGRLVEGSIGCDGLVDDVRISRGLRPISDITDTPLSEDGDTIGLWNFDDLNTRQSSQKLELENVEYRAKLPEYQIIPAANPAELSPSLGQPAPEKYISWHRSHGDASNSRYSSLTQINKSNVKDLEVAWAYNSGDATGNIQCNPIVVDGFFLHQHRVMR